MRTFNSKRSFTCSNSRHSYLCLLLLLSLKRQFFLTIFYAFDEWVRLKQRYEKNVSITVWWENFEVIHTLLLKIFCTQIFHFCVGKEIIWSKDWCTLIQTKHSSKTLWPLVWINMHQSLYIKFEKKDHQKNKAGGASIA